MSNIDNIHQVIEQAKQQRAEVIGSALRSAAVPVVLAAALSLVLVQFSSDHEAPQNPELAQVVSVER